jgi:hypothetical protein
MAMPPGFERSGDGLADEPTRAGGISRIRRDWPALTAWQMLKPDLHFAKTLVPGRPSHCGMETTAVRSG